MQTLDVDEKETSIYADRLVDENDVGIPSSSLNAFTLTLIEPITGSTVNSRNAQNVLNLNNVTVADTGPNAGRVAWELQVADVTFVQNPPPPVEYRRALFEWTYNGTKKGKLEVRFRITNKRMVS